MPYVDPGEPKEYKLPPIAGALPYAAVAAASVLTPLLWYGCYQWFGYPYVGAILAGILVGLAGKLTLRQPIPPLRVAAIILVVIGTAVGYIWVDSKIWTPFMLDKSIERFFRDIMALLAAGFGGYLAFIFATPAVASPPSGQGDPS